MNVWCLKCSVCSDNKNQISGSQSLWTSEHLGEKRSNIREYELCIWTLCNAVTSSYSRDQIICYLSLISLYMAVSVMIWQVVECTVNRQLCDYVFQKYFIAKWIHWKLQSALTELPNNMYLIRHVFTPFQVVTSPQASTYQAIWTKICFLPHTLKILKSETPSL
jgi:hypothetical protein